MSPSRSLPVFMPRVPQQRWSCHSCGDCCRALVGHLFPHERDRLEEEGWANRLGTAPYVRAGNQWVLNKNDDGACVFLDNDNRCRIHAESGEQAKPLACRIFPFSIRPVAGGWQATLRFDCPSVTDSIGEPMDGHRAAVQALADSMPHAEGRRPIKLNRRLRASAVEVEGLQDRLLDWLVSEEATVQERFVVVARLAAALHQAKLKKVRDERFLELVDLLLGGFAAERGQSPGAPSRRQQGMARQFVLASTESVSLQDLRSGLTGRLRKRTDQLARARCFLRGAGEVPPLPGVGGLVTFEAVERVGPAREQSYEIENLLLRYAHARLTGASVFGEGCYGWPITAGLGALVMSIVAVAWVSRARAATQDRTTINYQDAAAALRLVDRCATRVRALGTTAERARIAFLLEEDGLARLVHHYWLAAGT